MKKALASALMIGGGGCGGIVAGNVFRAKDAPGYRPGVWVCIGAQIVTITLILKNFYVFSRANRLADRGERLIEGTQGFRYTL